MFRHLRAECPDARAAGRTRRFHVVVKLDPEAFGSRRSLITGGSKTLASSGRVAGGRRSRRDTRSPYSAKAPRQSSVAARNSRVPAVLSGATNRVRASMPIPSSMAFPYSFSATVGCIITWALHRLPGRKAVPVVTRRRRIGSPSHSVLNKAPVRIRLSSLKADPPTRMPPSAVKTPAKGRPFSRCMKSASGVEFATSSMGCGGALGSGPMVPNAAGSRPGRPSPSSSPRCAPLSRLHCR